MAVELLLSAALPALFEKLASSESYNFLFEEGVRSKLVNWERKLEKIDAVLSSAEEKQLISRPVKLWLEDLQHLAYDVEDILEEFAYEASKHRSTPSCFKNFTPRAIKFDYSMQSRIEDITRRFEELYRERAELGLIHESSGGASSAAAQQRPPNASLLPGIAVQGRDGDRERILKMVSSDAAFSVIAIVGMGGLGKTTLAREVYNDKALDSLEFAKKIWVSTSGDFDVFRISKLLLASIDESVGNPNASDGVQKGNPSASDGLQKGNPSASDGVQKGNPSASVGVQKGNPSASDGVQKGNPSASDGVQKGNPSASDGVQKGNPSASDGVQKGNPSASDGVQKGNPNTLDGVQSKLKEKLGARKVFIVLDDVWNEDSSLWETFESPFIGGASGSRIIVTTRNQRVAQIMGSSKTYNLDFLSDEDCWQIFMKYAPCPPEMTESIRPKIDGKCRGLPLAAKTLGSLLRSMEIKKWENVLNSKILDSSDVGGILPVLKLSYYHLPPHLKRCFSYCAIFPKDYEFEEKELGFLWMAEGLIQPLNPHLDLAGEYFRDLCSRSLFQKSTSDNSKYIMHDLVHDLAQSISGEVCFRLGEGANTKSPKTFEKTRRLSYTANECGGKDFFKDLEKFKRLRTFFPVSEDFYSEHFLCAMVLFDVLPQLKKLRVLSLKRYQITYLPDSIGDLTHLRYLNFSSSRIKILPESISQLLNLQTLILKDCSCLRKLPSKMRCLTNLYHLDISGTNSLEEMPSRMKELKNLRMLSNFIVGKESSSNLEDLKSLNFLKGELHILKLENANDVKQLGGLILNSKKDLKVLILEWKSPFDGSREAEKEKNVLDMLKPHSDLQELTIRYYGGLEFPSWLSTSPSLSKLTVLRLKNCENCTNLPSLSLLSSLKKLQIKGMSKLERIDMQSSYNSLEIICLKNLQNCQCLDTKVENDNGGRFPNLHELSIIDCPKLIVELPDHLPLLEVLSIQNCAKWIVSFSSFPKLTTLSVDKCKKVVPTSSSTDQYMSLKSDESLPNIEDSKSEIRLSQNFSCVEKPLKESHSLIFLDTLIIENCSISFLDAIFLPKLKVLTIENIEALESLPEILKQCNIERLKILQCHSLLFIAKNTLPSSLKFLWIYECENLKHLEDISSTSLEILQIGHCESLTCLSLPGTLKDLWITFCEELTTLSIHGKLERLFIWNCRKLKSIEEAIHNGPSLKMIHLDGLQSLKQFSIQNLTGLLDLTIRDSSVSLQIENIPTSMSNLDIMGNVEMSKALINQRLHKFTSLKSLSISGFEDLQLSLQEDQRTPLPLESLAISNLASFRSISNLDKLTSLKSLDIQDSNLNSIPDLGSHSSLEELSITNCTELKSVGCLSNLTSLQTLVISDCPKLKSLPKPPPSLLELEIENSSLEELSITNCTGLKSVACLRNLTSLQTLVISNCRKLKSLPKPPPSLLELEIENSSLEKLRITNCTELKSVACLRKLTSLQTLVIFNCPKLKSLPKPPPSLLELEIEECPLLQKHWRRGKGKYCSKIAHIPRVEIDGKLIFNSKED